jgi:nucleoside-diphosphate-sugar epimerase
VTTLVTGATGHAGANLVRALVARGEQVRVTVRERDDLRPLVGLPVEQVTADLRDRAAIDAAMRGVKRVYHLAAAVSLRRADLQQLFDVNVLGTRKVVEAALANGVERLVHCSSLGAIGRNPGGVSDESFTINPFETCLDYECTKAHAEHEVLRAVLNGLDAVIVNPSGMVGPWDFAPSSVGQTILDFANGKLTSYVDGAFDFVAMRDVVDGHLAAMERGRKGERYILSSEYLSIRMSLGILGEILGRPAPTRRVPLGVVRAIAPLKDAIETRFFPDKIPRFTAQTIRLLNSGKRADAGKSRRELGVTPTPIRDAYRDHVDWFRSHGYLNA